ncbi:hypothetical protein MMC20_006744 [Loxospora ochrophaea]|nr:hypothetical protein [Loxospora ochrophaea]
MPPMGAPIEESDRTFPPRPIEPETSDPPSPEGLFPVQPPSPPPATTRRGASPASSMTLGPIFSASLLSPAQLAEPALAPILAPVPPLPQFHPFTYRFIPPPHVPVPSYHSHSSPSHAHLRARLPTLSPLTPYTPNPFPQHLPLAPSISSNSISSNDAHHYPFHNQYRHRQQPLTPRTVLFTSEADIAARRRQQWRRQRRLARATPAAKPATRFRFVSENPYPIPAPVLLSPSIIGWVTYLVTVAGITVDVSLDPPRIPETPRLVATTGSEGEMERLRLPGPMLVGPWDEDEEDEGQGSGSETTNE